MDLEAIKAQIAAAKKKIAASMAAGSGSGAGLKRSLDATQPSSDQQPPAKKSGGLKMEIHPLLMAAGKSAVSSNETDSKDSPANSATGAPPSSTTDLNFINLIPKRNFATTAANIKAIEKKQQRLAAKMEIKPVDADSVLDTFQDPSKNPYFDPSIKSKSAAAPKPRNQRVIKFNQRGKYIAQANQMRAAAHLERLKQQIAATVKRTGMDVELDLVADQGIRRQAPPEIEWWDAPLLPTGSYSDFDEGRVVLDDDNIAVTHLIQHPIPIQPPVEAGGAAVARPVMLTKKEQKKLRRQMRRERQQETQDKIRLGLLPPPQPKVNLSNLMRVLGSDAIQDPTKVEAEVRAQMERRAAAGRKHNEEKKLTEEEKREKKMKKFEETQDSVVDVAVFRVKNLTDKRHQFKVDKNAQQCNLTGMVVIAPSFSVVVVEGNSRGLRHYKKLMMRRIDWSGARKPGSSRNNDDENGGGDNGADDNDTFAALDDLCIMVWEGQVKERMFKGFRFYRNCTDERGVELFSRSNCLHYWNSAKTYISQFS